MANEGVAFTIKVLENGECEVFDAGGSKKLKELTPLELGESMTGKTINKVADLPKMTYMRSNPGWVCIGGKWYYIP